MRWLAGAEDILNELIKVYNKSIVDEKNTLAVNTSAFIDNQLARVEDELLSIEQKLQQYKSTKGAIDINTQGKLI